MNLGANFQDVFWRGIVLVDSQTDLLDTGEWEHGDNWQIYHSVQWCRGELAW